MPRPLVIRRRRLVLSRSAPKTDEGGWEVCPCVISGRLPGRPLPASPEPELPAGAAILTSRPWATAGHCLQSFLAVMSVLTPLLLRGLTGLTRRLPVQRAQIHSKPPQEHLGTMVRSGPGRAREMQRARLGFPRRVRGWPVWRAGPRPPCECPAPRARSLAGSSSGLGVSGRRE